MCVFCRDEQETCSQRLGALEGQQAQARTRANALAEQLRALQATTTALVAAAGKLGQGSVTVSVSVSVSVSSKPPSFSCPYAVPHVLLTL